MIIGFTGPRGGMTLSARHVLTRLLARLPTVEVDDEGACPGTREVRRELHHGDCVGCDAEAHDVARALGYWIVVHPPVQNGLRAFKEGDETRTPREYIARNHDIVNECELLVSTPESSKDEVARSGTWATIRYARSIKRRHVLIYPDGSTATVAS